MPAGLFFGFCAVMLSTPPTAAPQSADNAPCGAPLQLNASDLLRMGKVVNLLAKTPCWQNDAQMTLTWPAQREVTLGRIALWSTAIGAERLGLSMRLMMVDDSFGRAYPRGLYGSETLALRYVPTLDLPPSWQTTINPVMDAVVVVGGTAILLGIMQSVFSEKATHH